MRAFVCVYEWMRVVVKVRLRKCRREQIGDNRYVSVCNSNEGLSEWMKQWTEYV